MEFTCHLGLIIQLRFSEYKKLCIIQFLCFSSRYEQLKEKIHWNHRKDRFRWNEVESDLDKDVDIKMNDSETEFFGNNELDYNSGFASYLMFIVHHLEALPLIVHLKVEKHWQAKWKSTIWANSKRITTF